MRMSDALAKLSTLWGVPFSELETYHRALTKAQAIPHRSAGRGISHVSEEAIIKFVIAFCASPHANSAAERLASVLKCQFSGLPDSGVNTFGEIATGDEKTQIERELQVVSAKDLMSSLRNIIRENIERDQWVRAWYRFDQRASYVEVEYASYGFKGEVLFIDPSSSIPVDFDGFRQTREIGPSTVKILCDVKKDAEA